MARNASEDANNAILWAKNRLPASKLLLLHDMTYFHINKKDGNKNQCPAKLHKKKAPQHHKHTCHHPRELPTALGLPQNHTFYKKCDVRECTAVDILLTQIDLHNIHQCETIHQQVLAKGTRSRTTASKWQKTCPFIQIATTCKRWQKDPWGHFHLLFGYIKFRCLQIKSSWIAGLGVLWVHTKVGSWIANTNTTSRHNFERLHREKLRPQTCGVGGRGAASIGERAVAFLANVHNARAPSRCCLGLVNEVSISKSTSIPATIVDNFVSNVDTYTCNRLSISLVRILTDHQS